MYLIKQKREHLKLTQEELAVKSGVARSLINQLETGKLSSTTTSTLGKIALALNCDITDLFSSDESLHD